MTRVMVRRRSEPVEAVQISASEWTCQLIGVPLLTVHDVCTRRAMIGDWAIKEGDVWRAMSAEQFAEEYERVDAALGRDV